MLPKVHETEKMWTNWVLKSRFINFMRLLLSFFISMYKSNLISLTHFKGVLHSAVNKFPKWFLGVRGEGKKNRQHNFTESWLYIHDAQSYFTCKYFSSKLISTSALFFGKKLLVGWREDAYKHVSGDNDVESAVTLAGVNSLT